MGMERNEEENLGGVAGAWEYRSCRSCRSTGVQEVEYRIQESECFAGNPGAAGERRMVKGVQELGSQEEYGMQKNRSQESELRRPNSELRTPNSY